MKTDGNTAYDVNLIGLPDLDDGDIEAASHCQNPPYMPNHAEIAEGCRAAQRKWNTRTEHNHRIQPETPVDVSSHAPHATARKTDYTVGKDG